MLRVQTKCFMQIPAASIRPPLPSLTFPYSPPSLAPPTAKTTGFPYRKSLALPCSKPGTFPPKERKAYAPYPTAKAMDLRPKHGQNQHGLVSEKAPLRRECRRGVLTQILSKNGSHTRYVIGIATKHEDRIIGSIAMPASSSPIFSFPFSSLP